MATFQDQAVAVLAAQIASLLKTMSGGDKTVSGVVKSALDNNHYLVNVEGTDYSIPSISDTTYSANTPVWVTYPQGDTHRGFILGLKRR